MRNTTKTTTSQASTAGARGDSVNQVTLIGRLVAAPELRHTASGKSVTTVRVATNGKSHAEFHDVVLWGQLANFACQYLGKGRLVYIEGRLKSRQWQATDGSTRRAVEIVANRLQALSSKSAPAAQRPASSPVGLTEPGIPPITRRPSPPGTPGASSRRVPAA
jgi:single-strand DNA-binding protein